MMFFANSAIAARTHSSGLTYGLIPQASTGSSSSLRPTVQLQRRYSVEPTSARSRRTSYNNSGQQDPPSAGTSRLFVYGTLLLDEVIRLLIDRVPDNEVATAPGWRVVSLPGRIYPGLVRGNGTALGRVYINVTNDEMNTLDAFEDPDYQLVSLRTTPGNVPAVSYVWPNDHLDCLWSLHDFQNNHSIAYLGRCRAWRQRYETRALANCRR